MSILQFTCFRRRSVLELGVAGAVLVVLSAAESAESAFGTWTVNFRKSTSAGSVEPGIVTLRIERHAKGEVFTVDRTGHDGRSTTDSTVLFLDGKPRGYQDLDCSGTQSSQRVDNRTVEILRTCEAGGWIHLVRRVTTDRKLVLEINGRRSGGRQVKTRLVLDKQQGGTNE
jgi:hypothetical protein